MAQPQPILTWVDIEQLLDNPKQAVRVNPVEDVEVKRQFYAKIEGRPNWVEFMYNRIRRII
jgi:hypothetical protein